MRSSRKWNGTDLTYYSKLFSSSSCHVGVTRDSRENLTRLSIEFHGELSNLPAQSNDLKPSASGGLRHSKKFLVARDALAELYHAERLQRGLGILTFGSIPVHVQVMLSPTAGRQDSHNTPKLVGDWLKMVGVINDDRHAQIWAARWKDYGVKGREMPTLIVIEPFAEVRMGLWGMIRRFAGGGDDATSTGV